MTGKIQVFVSVGTHAQSFNRLLEAMDVWAERNAHARVFVQVGNSTYVPKYFLFKKFLSDPEYEHYMREAEIVVSHAGAGTILHALTRNKPLVVVPRLKALNEHTDDHQLDLARALHAKGNCVCVEDISQLSTAIQQAQANTLPAHRERDQLVKKLSEVINLFEVREKMK